MDYIPTLYVDARGLAAEISTARMRHAYADPLMTRHLSDIEDELDAAARNCNLTLTAIDALRELVKARKISLCMTEDNTSIAKSLANLESDKK